MRHLLLCDPLGVPGLVDSRGMESAIWPQSSRFRGLLGFPNFAGSHGEFEVRVGVASLIVGGIESNER
jgi:hypothetical protein